MYCLPPWVVHTTQDCPVSGRLGVLGRALSVHPIQPVDLFPHPGAKIQWLLPPLQLGPPFVMPCPISSCPGLASQVYPLSGYFGSTSSVPSPRSPLQYLLLRTYLYYTTPSSANLRTPKRLACWTFSLILPSSTLTVRRSILSPSGLVFRRHKACPDFRFERPSWSSFAPT